MASALTSGAVGGANFATRWLFRACRRQRDPGAGPIPRLTSLPRPGEAVAEPALTGWKAGICFGWRLARFLEFS